jgi:hypothetical protein
MVGCFFILRWIERAITFHPVRYNSRDAWTLPHGAEDVWFTTTDGIRLHGWFFKAQSNALATVIYFHGNGGNISNIGWIGERLATRGFAVLLFDYRGYGRSEGVIEGEQGLYADAEAAYNYVLAGGAKANSVVLYGQSLGTAAAVDLAYRHQCAAVILESGLSSESDMASIVLPWFPRHMHFLTKNRFDSARKLTQVRCPVLVTHGEPDSTIPTEQGRKLFAAANEPKKLIVFPGVDHNVFGSLGVRYLDTISEFITDALKTHCD